MVLQRLLNVVEVGDRAILQHHAALAVFADRADGVGDHDDVGSPGLRAKGGPRLLLERRVADAGDLVDEIDIEVDRHRDAEGEARLHAGRVGVHWHVHECAELGEILDPRHQVVSVDSVDARDEAHVLRARQRSVEAAAEAEGP